ncbi:hypothetical protein ACIQ6Y_24680 [Streptomyces sp. NPDC096205]|uniref:hypothetical protein n=1 Tax=Streptomyces sp. NPDC096205 TaxID=3366081 RepID=UPI00380A2563
MRRTAPVVLLAVLLTACSSGTDHADRSDGPSTPGTPAAAAPAPRITLPLDPYQVSDEDYSTVSRALAELTDRCMREQGLRYDEEAPEGVATSATGTGHERRYGITVPETAEKYGYHLDGTPSRQVTPAPQSKRYQRALMGTGKPTGTDGQFDDGCAGRAHLELEKGIDMDAVDLPQWYKRESFQQSLSEPLVTKAFAAWSGCMAESGHHFRTPLDPLADRKVLGEKVTPYERAVATADIACKQRTGLVAAWRNSEAALQRSLIESRGPQLAKARGEAARLIARADRIVGADKN